MDFVHYKSDDLKHTKLHKIVYWKIGKIDLLSKFSLQVIET